MNKYLVAELVFWMILVQLSASRPQASQVSAVKPISAKNSLCSERGWKKKHKPHTTGKGKFR